MDFQPACEHHVLSKFLSFLRVGCRCGSCLCKQVFERGVNDCQYFARNQDGGNALKNVSVAAGASNKGVEASAVYTGKN